MLHLNGREACRTWRPRKLYLYQLHRQIAPHQRNHTHVISAIKLIVGVLAGTDTRRRNTTCLRGHLADAAGAQRLVCLEQSVFRENIQKAVGWRWTGVNSVMDSAFCSVS